MCTPPLRAPRRLALLAACALALAACDSGPDAPLPDPGDDPGDLPVDTAALRAVLGCDVTATALDRTEEGALAEADCAFAPEQYVEVEGGERFDVYAFRTGAPSTNVEVAMASADVDAYVFLLDREGGVKAFNDDEVPGGPSTDARARATLPPGTYLVVATSFFPGETGAYRLRLDRRVAPRP